MFSFRTVLLAALCGLLILSDSTRGQDDLPKEPEVDQKCELPDPLPPPKDFPNVAEVPFGGPYAVAGYETAFELNLAGADGKGGVTYYAEEVVDMVNSRGTINLQYGDKEKPKETINYLLNQEWSKESFTIRGSQCIVKNEENVKDAYDRATWFPKVFLEKAENWTLEAFDDLLGPSAILRIGFLNRGKFSYIEQVALRGYDQVNVWKGCVRRSDGKNSVIKYFFADRSMGVGLIPLRVDIGTVGEQSYHYVFSYFRQVSAPPFVGIPTGYGCLRLDGEQPTSIPQLFLDKDYRMEMEIVMSTLDEDGEQTDFSTATVYSAEIVYLFASDLMSFTQTTMDSKKLVSGNRDSFRYKVKKVIDVQEELIYETDLMTSECTIKEFEATVTGGSNATNSWDKLPPFEFSDNTSFKIMDAHLWFSGNVLQYMGTSSVRSFPTVVYESTFEDMYKDDDGEDRTVVVTRHYLNDDVFYDSEYMSKGAPINTVIIIYDKERTKFDKIITINIHSFQSAILEPLKKEKIFDISNCFKGKDESTWFQMNFLVEDMTMVQLLEASPSVEKAFREQLNDIAPSRLPKVLVDYDLNQITITARLLERPHFTYTFYKKSENKQIKPKATNPTYELFISDTPESCARACQVVDDCTLFSFCDSLECSTFLADVDKNSAPDVEDVAGCYLYDRKFKKDSETVLSMNRMLNTVILSQIQRMIQDKSFKLTIPVTFLDGTVKDKDIGATDLVRNVQPGWLVEQAENDRLGFRELTPAVSGYTVAQRNAKYLASDDDDKPREEFTKVLGLRPLSCAEKCNDDPECKSFSFCESDEGECTFSTLSSSMAKEEMVLKDMFFCTILDKSIMSTFDLYQSFFLDSVAKKTEMVNLPDDCARKCLDEESFTCRSFDYCVQNDESMKAAYCLMHEFHVAANANQRKLEVTKGVDMKFNSSQNACSHYSRRYSDDFTATKGSKFNENVAVNFQSLELTLEMCAHHCAENAGAACQTFDFCEKISASNKLAKSCKMSSSKTASANAEKDDSCVVYTRKISSDEENGSLEAVWKKPFASSGVSAFVAILFIAVGAALGGIVYKYKFANGPVV